MINKVNTYYMNIKIIKTQVMEYHNFIGVSIPPFDSSSCNLIFFDFLN